MRPRNLRHQALLAVVSLIVLLFTVSAGSGAEKEIKIILSGNVAESTPAHVTIEILEKLPLTEYKTTNPFNDKEFMYKGVLLKEIVKRYGGPGTLKLRFIAIDGYEAEFTRKEWERWDILLATQINGKPLPIMRPRWIQLRSPRK